MNALAYANWGRWVADCPVDGCHDARELAPGAAAMVCVNGHASTIRWPGDPASVAAITAALEERPEPKTRNWLPAGHPIAVASGYPVDQTPNELRAETHAAMQAAAEQRSQLTGIASLIAGAGQVTLDQLGLTLADDGTLVPTGKAA